MSDNATSATRPVPDVCLLGAAKCGTTSMYAWLSQHPEMTFTEGKEPRFFATTEFDQGMDFYRRRYLAHWDGQRVTCDGSTVNLYLPYVAPRIHAVNPDARLIAMFRNPVDQAYSYWWMLYTQRVEWLPFAEAIRRSLEDEEAGRVLNDPETYERYKDRLLKTRHPWTRIYLSRARYAEQLERYLSLFDRSQIHTILFRDVVQDPVGVLRRTCEFIGIDPSEVDRFDLRKENEATSIPLLRAWRRSAKNLLVRGGQILTGTPRNFPISYQRHKSKMDDDTRQWLIDYFAPSVNRLEEMLGVSLEHWRQ